MKYVFYNSLFKDKTFQEPTDKIIYSYLVYTSFMSINDVFEKDTGTFDYCVVKDFLEDNDNIEILDFSYSKISKELKMSLNTIKSRMRYLVERELVKLNGRILNLRYIDGIRCSPYFELQIESNLKGEVLILYSYLLHKSKNNNNFVTCNDKHQSEELGISRKYYQKMLCQLYSKCLVERTEDNKLKIN